jgi:O-antigen/teichoic acid export membrane protein
VPTEPPQTTDKASLAAAARGGARAGAVAGVAAQAIGAGVTVALVRLLQPDDFGVVAGAMTVLGLVSTIAQFGAGPAVVRRTRDDQASLSTLFWVTVAVGGLLTAATALAARPLAGAVGQPGAALVLAAMAPTLLLRMTASVPRALLQRRLRFRLVYAADVAAVIVAGAVQLPLAVLGSGKWVLVAGQLVSAAVVLVGAVLGARWRPSMTVQLSLIRDDLVFARGFTANMLLSYLGKNADYWAVSWFGGARALGVYYVAYVLPNIIRQRLTWAATDVLLPVFARLSERDDRREAYLRSLRLHVFVGFPAMAGLALVATPLIDTFFGHRWDAAAGPLRLLALAALAEFPTQAATTVFLAAGKPRRNAELQAARLVVLAVGLAVAIRIETLMSVAVVVLVATWAAGVLAQHYVARELGVSLGDVARVLLASAVPTLVMSGAVLLVARLTGSLRPWAQLALLGATGAAIYPVTGLLVLPVETKRALDEVGRLVGLGRRSRSPEVTASGPAPF